MVNSAPVPFVWEMADTAEQELEDAAGWQQSITSSADDGAHLLDRFTEEMTALCERWGEGFRPLPDEAATLVYSRPVFSHRFQTGQRRRRRSSAGVWRIFYAVGDADGDGAPDTLRVLSVRHSAARPLSIEPEED